MFCAKTVSFSLSLSLREDEEPNSIRSVGPAAWLPASIPGRISLVYAKSCARLCMQNRAGFDYFTSGTRSPLWLPACVSVCGKLLMFDPFSIDPMLNVSQATLPCEQNYDSVLITPVHCGVCLMTDQLWRFCHIMQFCFRDIKHGRYSWSFVA